MFVTAFMFARFPFSTKKQLLEFWRSDEWFGAQRLCGVTPLMIKLWEQIPEKYALVPCTKRALDMNEVRTRNIHNNWFICGFGVTEELVAPFLEGQSLASALENKKVFLVDFQQFDGIYHTSGYHVRHLA